MWPILIIIRSRKAPYFLLSLLKMKETLKSLRASLVPIYGVRETEAIIRIMFHYLKGWNLTDMLIHGEDKLSPVIKEEIKGIERRLLKQEPIQYITGEARFHGMEMKIRPGVLIPRPETEELVDLIIDDFKDKPDLRILDLCTGSGCIAISLVRNLPFSKVTAIDISPEAIEVAKENSLKLKTRINLLREDIFLWQPEHKFDIMVSNPPYVMDREALDMEKNVLDYEPHEALFVRDENPLVFYKRITDLGHEFLEDNGKLYLEINPLKVDELVNLMESKGFSDIDVHKDIYGKDRFLSCKK